MSLVLFYSWQSDLPSRDTRGLIKDAARDACARIAGDVEIDESPRIDSDTQGIPGMPEIASTIFDKIRASDMFLADVSLVEGVRCTPAHGEGRRACINPNVGIELGFAAAAIGWNRMIAVMNTDYGRAEELPFDLRHRRWPVTFSTSGSNLATARRSLSSGIESAMRSIIDSGVLERRRDVAPYGMDPLDRIVSHYLRDAIAAARFPLQVYLGCYVDPEVHHVLSQIWDSRPSNAKGSEFPPQDVAKPLVDYLIQPTIFDECRGPLAPHGMRWIDWFVVGMRRCHEHCDGALQRYAVRGPSVLVAEMEDLCRRVRHDTEVVSAFARTRSSGDDVDELRPLMTYLVLLLLRSERIWFNFLTRPRVQIRKIGHQPE